MVLLILEGHAGVRLKAVSRDWRRVVNYRHMGATGLRLSEVSLGAWLTFGDRVLGLGVSGDLHAGEG